MGVGAVLLAMASAWRMRSSTERCTPLAIMITAMALMTIGTVWSLLLALAALWGGAVLEAIALRRQRGHAQSVGHLIDSVVMAQLSFMMLLAEHRAPLAVPDVHGGAHAMHMGATTSAAIAVLALIWIAGRLAAHSAIRLTLREPQRTKFEAGTAAYSIGMVVSIVAMMPVA